MKLARIKCKGEVVFLPPDKIGVGTSGGKVHVFEIGGEEFWECDDPIEEVVYEINSSLLWTSLPSLSDGHK